LRASIKITARLPPLHDADEEEEGASQSAIIVVCDAPFRGRSHMGEQTVQDL